MPRKTAAKLTHPRLPGKKYVTERGLNQALAALDKRELTDKTIAQQAVKNAALAQFSKPETASNAGATAEAPTRPASFIRNRYHTEVSLRFERHDGKRRIELKPRGQRGDFAPIQPADLNEPVLIDNVNIGLIELISAGEAAEIASKQTTNQQKVHPALAVLRNELGEEYGDDAIKLEIPFEQQGVVVAELQDGQVVVDNGTGIRRKRAPGQEPASPDYIAGGAPTHHAPAGEEAAYLSDLRARAKTLEGPEAGLGGIRTVVVEQTQKS